MPGPREGQYYGRAIYRHDRVYVGNGIHGRWHNHYELQLYHRREWLRDLVCISEALADQVIARAETHRQARNFADILFWDAAGRPETPIEALAPIRAVEYQATDAGIYDMLRNLPPAVDATNAGTIANVPMPAPLDLPAIFEQLMALAPEQYYTVENFTVPTNTHLLNIPD